MKTKLPKHTAKLTPPTSNSIIQLFFEYAQLKSLYRQGWLDRSKGRTVPEEHCESVADHSFGVALLGYVIAEEYKPDLDSNKVMRLGLFHEIGEIYAGDLTPHDGVSLEDKSAREYSGVQRVFSHFPNPEKYIAIWREFEDGKTPEAVFVKQIDRLEMALQSNLYEHLGHSGLEGFFPYVNERLSSPELRGIFDDLLRTR